MSGENNVSMKSLLASLVKQSGAVTALLVTKEGTHLAEAGDTSFMNTTALAALIAAMFAATREVARMVGEKQFSILLQQGETRHIHISLVDDSTMMAIVFEDQQRIGRVRLEARKASEALAEHLRRSTAPLAPQKSAQPPELRELALNLIDSIFVGKGQ